MIYRSGLLTALLCAQLLVVAAMFYFDATESGVEQGEKVLNFSAGNVDKIVVSGAGDAVELVKQADGWMVGDQVPADAEKIDAVLSKLVELRQGWPVATSVSIQGRFGVAADNFQREVGIFEGGTKVAGLYLGSSPGYRRVHARNAQGDDIYSVDFSTFEVPTTTDDWLDKTVLGARRDIKQISLAESWVLDKTDEGWVLEDPDGGFRVANQDAANQLAERLSNLRVMELATAELEEGAGRVLGVTDADGGHELRIWHDEAADEYVFASDRVGQRYKVASYTAEQIIVGVQDLMPDPLANASGVDAPAVHED